MHANRSLFDLGKLSDRWRALVGLGGGRGNETFGSASGLVTSTTTKAAPATCLLRLALLAFGFALGSAPVLRAHGDDQLLIAALTEELAKAPEAELFLRRGELFRHHSEWDKAEADFVAAARLEPKRVGVDFFRARNLLESGDPAKALTFAERFLANLPEEPEAWFLRAEILAETKKFEAAAGDYASGIERSKQPRPENYLRHAKLIASVPGRDPARVLAALDAGITRIGPVISLVDFAIEIELESKNYAGALKRIATAMEHAPRREKWLVRQGDVLVKCGRATEAAAAYRAALAAIEELPERYRETVPVEKLARDARTSLSTLARNAER